MTAPQIIRTETGEELVVLTRRDYDAMRARAGDEAAEDAMTARLIDEARAAGGAALPLAIWDEIEAAASPVGPIRKFRGLTQAELAEKSGISQGYVSDIEKGKKIGDVATLRAIANTLGVSLDDLAKDEGESATLILADEKPRFDNEHEWVKFSVRDSKTQAHLFVLCTFDFFKDLGTEITNKAALEKTWKRFHGKIVKIANEKYQAGDRTLIVTSADYQSHKATHRN